MGLLTLLLPAACGADDRTAAAIQAFEQFQDALFAGDPAAARALVTEASAPVVDEVPWEAVASRQRLVPAVAVDMRGSYHVDVRDPNDGGATGTYVVVRERGRMVVDLVATAALHATVTEATATPMLEPRELGPDDLDAIRRYEQAAPPTGG